MYAIWQYTSVIVGDGWFWRYKMADVLRQYNGDSLYLAAFAASLVLIWFVDTKRGQGKTGKKALTAVLFAIIFIFNEFAYRIVGKLTDATTYYRFFWMLPVVFVTAYVMTQAFTGRNRGQAVIAAAVLAVCLITGANFFFLNRANFNRPKNIYGLDPEVLTIADEIMADWDSSSDKPVAAFNMYLEYQVRTYEPRILWGISRNAYLYQAKNGYDYKKYVRQQHIIAAVNEGIQNDSRALRRSILKSGVDYLVIQTEFDMDSYLAQISVLPVAQSENYTIYRVRE